MSELPLKGKRVIELGTMVAAPFATHILSQLGAEIVKVEPPTGDTTRALVRGGPSGTFVAYNHNKRSLAIDLGTSEGQIVFRKLVVTADALVHNLAPASARKLRVTAEDLGELNPDLICCHIRGYAEGPQAEELATNPVAEASTGVMDDHRIDGRPSRLGPSYHDQFAGAYAVIRLLATWLDATETTAGRRIDIGLYETGLHVAGRELAGMQLKTQLLGRPEKEAGGEFAIPGYGAYETADGRWLYLLTLTDAHWRRLTEALDMPERNDSELQSLRQRRNRRERVEAAVDGAIGSLTFEAAAQRLRASGFGFTEVLPLERVLEAPQARQPGKLRSLHYRQLAFEVPEFPGSSSVNSGLPPPELGEHSMEVLSELGFDDKQCSALLELGAVAVAGADEFSWAPVRRRG